MQTAAHRIGPFIARTKLKASFDQHILEPQLGRFLFNVQHSDAMQPSASYRSHSRHPFRVVKNKTVKSVKSLHNRLNGDLNVSSFRGLPLTAASLHAPHRPGHVPSMPSRRVPAVDLQSHRGCTLERTTNASDPSRSSAHWSIYPSTLLRQQSRALTGHNSAGLRCRQTDYCRLHITHSVPANCKQQHCSLNKSALQRGN